MPIFETPDLSKEFHPVLKPQKRQKKSKVQKWDEGRDKLKAIFRDMGITSCELMGATGVKCIPKNFLGFAHIKRRNDLTEEEKVDPHFVVLACQPEHEALDFKMPKDKAEAIMEKIIKARGW